LPGKKITDHQVHKYKQHRLKLNQAAAAAKAGLSERSARRIEIAEALPSQRESRAWRTRIDPLTAVWDSEVVPLLKSDGALNAVTLCCARCSGVWASGAPSTAKSARSTSRRSTRPAAWGCRTSPWPTTLDISLGGLAFPHRLYQFALAHSGWRHVRVVLGGESFQSLAAGCRTRCGWPVACPKSTAPTACRRRSTTWLSAKS
jgi:hypothetical protein